MKIDLGFVVDSSYSLRNEYHKEKEFVKKLARLSNLSPDGTRAGVVTYSIRAKTNIKLTDYTDIGPFENAVDQIPLMGLRTRTDRGLRMAQNELFADGNGIRKGVPKVIVLLTDGSQTPSRGYEDPWIPAEELRKSGIHVLVIGIGEATNRTELDLIAGGTGKAHLPKSFDDLIDEQFIRGVTQASCEEAKKIKSKFHVYYFH